MPDKGYEVVPWPDMKWAVIQKGDRILGQQRARCVCDRQTWAEYICILLNEAP